MPDLTADQCEQIFHNALASGDVRGVEAALTLLAVRDPHRAQTLLDTMSVALAIADVSSDSTEGEDHE